MTITAVIDPLATVIQYLKGAGLSVTQIAEKSRYGDTWDAGTRGIVVRLDGGSPEIDLPVQAVRLEVRCYAENSFYALQVLGELITLSRSIDREPVVVGANTALLYYLVQASGPSVLMDMDISMDFALMFFEAEIAESAVL